MIGDCRECGDTRVLQGGLCLECAIDAAVLPVLNPEPGESYAAFEERQQRGANVIDFDRAQLELELRNQRAAAIAGMNAKADR